MPLPKAKHLCGAKTRSGKECQNAAMANGRCRLHGGKSTGAPEGNKNSAKPGAIYSKFMTDEELEIAEQVELDNLDQEIKVYRIRLYRLLKEEREQEDNLELKTRTTQTPVVGGLPITADEGEEEDLIETKQYIKKDYTSLINQTTARLQSLISQRNALISTQLDNERKRIELNAMKSGSESEEVKSIVVEVIDARKT
ncbi:TPA: hypothetical protein R4328_001437 [Pasteurella multocida]|nr:hypothetical protein [Pasteurella multocida]